jgi:hypothetical protein
MDAIAPSGDTISVLSEMARSGFIYRRVKELAQTAGWRITDDELDFGFVAFELHVEFDEDPVRRLNVEVTDSGRQAFAFVPLFYFEDYETSRELFDLAFQTIRDQLTDIIGAPLTSGEHLCTHRNDWPYSFSLWSGDDAVFALVQDEFDIQFGMDVTLWIFPAGTLVTFPISDNLDRPQDNPLA